VSDDSLQRRIDFLINLLAELKILYEQSNNKFVDIENSSANLYESIFHEYKGSIQHEVDKYEANVKEIAQLNYQIIERINQWYGFSKDHKEMKRLFFPVRFYLNKLKLRKQIKKANQEINRITVENRFIKEKLVDWEYELEDKALQQIKQSEHFEKYLLLLEKKNDLISDFEYLLSTLPVTYPINLDIKDIDNFVENLRTISAV